MGRTVCFTGGLRARIIFTDIEYSLFFCMFWALRWALPPSLLLAIPWLRACTLPYPLPWRSCTSTHIHSFLPHYYRKCLSGCAICLSENPSWRSIHLCTLVLCSSRNYNKYEMMVKMRINENNPLASYIVSTKNHVYSSDFYTLYLGIAFSC